MSGWDDSPTRTCVVAGVPIDAVSLDGAVALIAGLVQRGRAAGTVHQVATVNVDFVVNASDDPQLRRILQRSDVAIPDGMPVVWASRLLGVPIGERTTGIDLVPALGARCAADGFRMLLFGGAPGVAERAADVLRTRAPGLDISVVDAPDVASDGTMDDTVLDAIRARTPDIVCVALGNPKQERWIERHAAAVGAPVLIGVGGSLDFLTGVTRRAPTWMQRGGLEWLHRALSEPRRLVGRYARDFRVFGPAVARQCWQGRRRGQAIAPGIALDERPPRLEVRGPLPLADPEPAVLEVLRHGGELVVDVQAAGRLDNASISVLAGLARTARRHGATVRLRGAVKPWCGDLGDPSDLLEVGMRDQSVGESQ